MLGACMEILTTHTTKFNGTVIKTIGDNLMCVFDDLRAPLAANEMQQKAKIAIEAQDSVAARRDRHAFWRQQMKAMMSLAIP